MRSYQTDAIQLYCYIYIQKRNHNRTHAYTHRTLMLRTFFSFIALLCSIACVILLHTMDILEEGCFQADRFIFVSAYTNATVWMAITLFLCLPFLRSIGKFVRINLIPPLITILTSSVVLVQVSNIECHGERMQAALFCSGSTLCIAFLLFFSEVNCPKKEQRRYEEIA